MYIHPKFAIPPEEALGLAARVGFGLLVAFDDAKPVGAHLPFLIEGEGEARRIAFHTARTNPIAALADGKRPFMLAVTGPDTYISPDWYATADQVSTWLYEAVHITGPARRLDLADHLAHVDALSAIFEERLLPKKPWTSAKMTPARREAMLNGIVALEMRIDTIEGQRKLNQHKGDADHAAIVGALDAGADPKGHAVADMMRQLRPGLDYGDPT